MNDNTVSQQVLGTILICHGLEGGIYNAAKARTNIMPGFVFLHPILMSL